ncbi:MAG TPA: GNAT family N-acetyltransferase [Devosia sp.]|jgi:ribosomal protein S18 acetylase RimI-like enzyme|uniref:GNAT family N-acetyltransferase n=1 Tax=Devosia sp. TaxID=1871048 RepID=UPI002DDD6D16|nr:GNAT family N-acetyltransferase [Devosia sp.]HEV2517808.1 GNAT family N-acetyltransferase [Devosia sp.]
MIELRRATAADAPAIAALFRRSRAVLSFLPELHTADEDLWFVRTVLIGEQRVTLAVREGQLLGFMAEHEGWITQLYLDPGVRRGGVGSALLADAKSRNPELTLWCFAQNAAARAFYEAQGFVVVEETDGAGNEARLPDVRYWWRGAD